MHGQAISLSKNRAFVASLGFLLWLLKYCGGIYANNDFRVAREILRNIFEVNQFIHVCLISFFPMCICTFQQFFASISSFSSKIFKKKMRGDFLHSTVCDSNMMAAYSLALYNLHKKLQMKKHGALFFLHFSSVPFQFSYTPFCAVIVMMKH